MDPRVRDILRKQYPVVVGVETDADGREHFAAWLLDLPGCVAQGETRDEATARLEAIKPAYLGKLLDLGTAIPEPTQFPAVIPGLAWFYNLTGAARQSRPGELPEPEVRGTGWLKVVAA
jgi:predicted RNase H-like HicB family nuclease